MNNSSFSKENISSDGVNLTEIFYVLSGKKKLIISITLIFAVLSVLISLSLTNYYKSEALLTIAGQSNSSNALSGLGGIASVASMAGINLPSSNSNRSVIAIKTIESRAFLKHLISFEGVLPSIMASKSYDHNSNKILFDPDIYLADTKEWVREPKDDKLSIPSYLEAYDVYLKRVSISEDKLNNLISISVEHISPIFAKELLELIISQANELIRSKDLRESSDAIAFLNNEIPSASLITMKDAINKLVQSQLEKQMLSRVNTEYVLKVIEPPFIPENKSRPSRAIICILGTFFGAIIAIISILMRQYFFREQLDDVIT